MSPNKTCCRMIPASRSGIRKWRRSSSRTSGRLSSAQSVAELAILVRNKKGAPSGAFCVCRTTRRLLRRRVRRRTTRTLELLALLFGPLLQFFLQLLLVFLEYLRIGRRAVIGLGELTGERQWQRQRRAVGIDRLNDEVLALLQA